VAALTVGVAARGWRVVHVHPGVVPDRDPEVAHIDRTAVVAQLQNAEGQYLFGFVRRLGLTDEQADDAVQEVLVRLLAELRNDIVIANPRAWAYRSIYRLAMDQYRLRRRLRGLIGGLSGRTTPSHTDLTDRIAVWAEVDKLPVRQRQVIYLRYRSDLPFEEIGQILGITPSAARSHATQAMARLRERLAGSIEDVR
jgi:RNA polymerase sigma factor (sigma-70 family)